VLEPEALLNVNVAKLVKGVSSLCRSLTGEATEHYMDSEQLIEESRDD
jgi:hypothetical protein